jgi:hypothetical protein
MSTVDKLMALAEIYVQSSKYARAGQVKDDREALRAALVEALDMGEPVAWISPTNLGDLIWARAHPTPIIASAHCWQVVTASATIPLYTHPAQPSAEPLTNIVVHVIEGYKTGLSGGPMGFVSEAFDCGYVQGEQERAAQPAAKP